MKRASVLWLFFGLIFLLACEKESSTLTNFGKEADGSSREEVAMKNRWYFDEFLQEVNALPDPQQKMALVDSFMTYAAQFGFPLTEDSLCHFLYRGNPTYPFSVAGDFNGWQPNVDNFVLISGTNLYYKTKVFPTDARLDYKLVMNQTWMLDPLNPHQIMGGFGPNSELRMPDWVYPWEIDYIPSNPHGSVLQHTFHSAILNNDRTVLVYLPPGYAQDTTHYPAIYVQDGGEYVTLASMVNVLDNLLAAGLIQPIVAVFVDPVNRNSEYWLNDNYVAMLVTELLPYIEANYRVRPQSEARAIMGASLGGLISLYAAYQHPEVFGLVAGQSSALWVNNATIINLYSQAPRKDLQVYLDWGTFESSSQATLHQQFVGILQSKGYPVTWGEYHEGHSWGNWRAHIDEILKTFWPTQVTGIFHKP